MKSFNKQNLQEIRSDVNAALAEVAKKHGIVLNIATISFTEKTFSSKLMAEIIDTSSTSTVKTQMSGQELKWRKSFMTTWFELLKKDDLGKEVTIGRTTYTIAGARPRAQNPIVLRKSNGAFTAASEDSVAQALGR